MRVLTNSECREIKGGEVITLTAVLAVLATAIVSVIVYRLFMSSKGGATLPGGWKFNWE